MHVSPITAAIRRADARAGWGPVADANPPASRARRLARAYTAGPLRDTALIALGGGLVGLGYLLHALVAAAGGQ